MNSPNHLSSPRAVSYTHLDVYKRQMEFHTAGHIIMSDFQNACASFFSQVPLLSLSSTIVVPTHEKFCGKVFSNLTKGECENLAIKN